MQRFWVVELFSFSRLQLAVTVLPLSTPKCTTEDRDDIATSHEHEHDMAVSNEPLATSNGATKTELDVLDSTRGVDQIDEKNDAVRSSSSDPEAAAKTDDGPQRTVTGFRVGVIGLGEIGKSGSRLLSLHTNATFTPVVVLRLRVCSLDCLPVRP